MINLHSIWKASQGKDLVIISALWNLVSTFSTSIVLFKWALWLKIIEVIAEPVRDNTHFSDIPADADKVSNEQLGYNDARARRSSSRRLQGRRNGVMNREERRKGFVVRRSFFRPSWTQLLAAWLPFNQLLVRKMTLQNKRNRGSKNIEILK